MRYMGIDYGTKRIGLALSDESGTLAFPELVLLNGDDALESIVKLAQERGVGQIVLGQSLDYHNRPNAVMSSIEYFREELVKKIAIPITYQPEQMSTVAAERFQGKTVNTDASAAAIILQWYLDTTHKK